MMFTHTMIMGMMNTTETSGPNTFSVKIIR